jgi:hypothetical protein
MKFIFNAIWLPVGLVLLTVSSALLAIIYRDSLSTTTLIISSLISLVSALYFMILLFRSLHAFSDSATLQKVLNKIDPSQQKMINDQRLKEHNESLIYLHKNSQHREIIFFGDHKQCTVYAPNENRALSFYNEIPKEIQQSGGKFYYSRKGFLNIVRD